MSPTPAVLSALPPGTRTDLEVLQLSGSTIEQGDGYVVVRSPRQPTFHWGNCLHVTTGDVEDADHWTSAFAAEFPDADWLAIGLPAMPTGGAWQLAQLTPEQEDVLSRHGMPELRPRPEGYAVREFATQADWDQLLDADLRERARDIGSAPASYARFSRERQRSRQGLVDRGLLSWWGAFSDEGELASSLGIVLLDEHRARYQSVLTEAGHRGRGLAGHLLGVAAQWAADRGAHDFVIVTEAVNPAGRLYRGVGFAPDAAEVAVYRPPAEELEATGKGRDQTTAPHEVGAGCDPAAHH